MVISPAWELVGHSSSAKSTDVHWVIALELPKIPLGALKMTFLAISGLPGSARVKEVCRVGCPPAWVVEVVVVKDVIGSEARAGAVAVSEKARATTTASVLAPTVVFSLLICVLGRGSAMSVGLAAVLGLAVVEWQGASQPPALPEPDVTVSRHTAPPIQLLVRTSRQWTNSSGSRVNTSARSCHPFARRPLSRLNLRTAQRIRYSSMCHRDRRNSDG